jgi:mercuric ion transport protein
MSFKKTSINKISAISSGIASLIAITASSCCIIPIVLVNMGIGGAWLGNLAVLQPYRIHFIVVAILMFIVGFTMFIRRQLQTGKSCASNDAGFLKRSPIILLISALLIALAIIWPEIEPYLLRIAI